MNEELILDEAGYAIWQELKSASQPLEISELVERTGVHQSVIAACTGEGAEKGLMQIEELEREELNAASGVAEILKRGLPERLALKVLEQKDGRVTAADLAQWAKGLGLPANEVFKWGPQRGWMEREKGSLAITDFGRQFLDRPDDDEKALQQALSGPVFLDELEGLDLDRVRKLLVKRSDLARIRRRTLRRVGLTREGRQMLEENRVRVKQERNSLRPEDIESGLWKEITLRPYDVTLPARTEFPAKIHPMRKIMEETRRAFLEMGFTEVVSPMVESAFWNFDALYQPQDHPARDMQDTFYMKMPSRIDLPDKPVVENVRRTHEDGWTTGSEGWGYKWKTDESKRPVLRTHTTAATIRALARHPKPPGKFFCVGWTYRNETISFKHLPVFHQVDGIVVDEDANLSTLLGTLQAFYHKMGFGKVKFKPAFYPYTEPSVDVVVYMESRGKWLEMGGSGIFRPEVTEPLGCRHPVLAWGLGMERLAMLRYGFSDIRELYRSNLDLMEGVPLCR